MSSARRHRLGPHRLGDARLRSAPTCAWLVAAFVAGALACGDARHLDPADAEPAITDGDLLDTGPALDAEPPADGSAPDAGPADATLPRRLVRRPLLGQTAPDNRIVENQLDPTGQAWLVPNAGGNDAFLRLRREIQPDAPSDAPILRVRPARDLPSALLGTALATGGPLDARVWVGHRIDVPNDRAVVSLSGTDAQGLDVAVTLLPSTHLFASPVAHVEWILYEGRWSGGAVGEIQLLVEDTTVGLELFVTGPEIVEARRERALEPPTARAVPRPMTPRDYQARATLQALRRERPAPAAGSPPRPELGTPLRPLHAQPSRLR